MSKDDSPDVIEDTDISRQAFGRWAEGLAARAYRRRGFEIIDRNWRCRDGEIDLIVRRHDLLVFVEVKARRSGRLGTAASAVDHRKQRRLRRLAAAWLATHPVGRAEIRFDVAAIDGVRLEIIEAAF